MTAAPPPTDPAPPGHESDTGTDDRGNAGPRVSSDQMRDLARIRRSTGDRKIAGVAGGLARHFDVDPLLVRVALVVLIFFGGGGLLVYLAGWLLLPEDDGTPAAIRLDDRSRMVALAIAGGLAGLALVGDSFGGWEFPWPLAIVGIIAVIVLSRRSNRQDDRATAPGAPGAPGTPAAGAAYTSTDPRFAGYQPGDDPEPYDEGPTTAHGRGATGMPGMPPVPPMPPSPRPPSASRKPGPVLFGFALALAALAVGVLGTLQLAGVDVPLAAYPAAVMATCGVMLLVGAFFGRGGGLIFVGLVAAAATATTAMTDEVPDLSVGEVHRTPTSAADVQDEKLGIGDMRIDLTQVGDLDELDGDAVSLDLRVGRLEVIVPDEGLTVEVKADIQGVGQIQLFGDRADRSDEATHDGGASAPVLELETDLFVGEIVVWTEEEAAA